MKKILNTLTLFLLPFTAFSQNQTSIFIDVIHEGSFEVFYHRAESAATGAIIGGIIGAAVEEGIRNGNDTKKEKQITPLLSDTSCKTKFLSSLSKKLIANNFDILNEKQKDSLLLEIKIQHCGFKMVDTSSKKVSTFIRFGAKLKTNGRKKNHLKETYYITSKNQYFFDELINSAEKTDEEVAYALERAGKRLANTIIYQKED